MTLEGVPPFHLLINCSEVINPPKMRISQKISWRIDSTSALFATSILKYIRRKRATTSTITSTMQTNLFVLASVSDENNFLNQLIFIFLKRSRRSELNYRNAFPTLRCPHPGRIHDLSASLFPFLS